MKTVLRWFKRLVVLAILGGIGYAAYAYFSARKQEGGTVRYRSAPFVKMDIFRTVEATGTVQPIKKVEVGAQVNGKIIKLFVDYKREAIKYVILHPRSITSAVVLFQRFNDSMPVFGEPSDAILLKTAQDSLTLVYPRAELVTALRDQVDMMSRSLELANRFGEVGVSSFPELVMPDVDGRMRKLSDLEGHVVVVSFWSVGQTDHKMFNVDLAEIYRKYHDQGLEVYQVSLDIDKPLWASTVRSQDLPWISVNDGYGVESSAVASYNIQSIPTMFVFDKKGELVGTDVFDKDALDLLIRKSL